MNISLIYNNKKIKKIIIKAYNVDTKIIYHIFYSKFKFKQIWCELKYVSFKASRNQSVVLGNSLDHTNTLSIYKLVCPNTY